MRDLLSGDRRQFLAAIGVSALAGGTRADEVPLAPPDKQPPELEIPEPPRRTAGWAIVGLGKLALEEVMPAFGLCKLSRPSALVSGHPEKARKVAAVYDVGPKHIYNYDNFDRLIDDEGVDIVYIILPNSMHAEFTIRALKAGKHVLCEKPLSATVAEAEQMVAAARDAKKKLMTAYRLRYEPFHMAAIRQCREQTFGELKSIGATNGQNVKAPNIRLSKKLAGGPVGDVGIYCLNAARYLTNEEPEEVTAFARRPPDDPRFREVPASVTFSLRFPGGVLAHCDCSFASGESRRLRVLGDEGVLDMENAFGYYGQRLFVETAGKRTEFSFRPANHFTEEMDHFSRCVLEDQSPRTPGEEGLADMRIIAAIEEAAESGRTVRIARPAAEKRSAVDLTIPAAAQQS